VIGPDAGAALNGFSPGLSGHRQDSAAFSGRVFEGLGSDDQLALVLAEWLDGGGGLWSL
jgi:hypothetical protein